MKDVRITLISVLLGGFVCRCESQVTITTPPEDTTVCRGSDVTISCGYDSDTPLNVLWTINRTIFVTQSNVMNISSYQLNNCKTPVNYSLTVFSINATTTIRCTVASQVLNVAAAISPDVTVTVIGPTSTILTAANVNFSNDTIVIVASWQGPKCTGNNSIAMYNITVMDQYSPAIITVPANMSSVEISQFPENGTSIVANKEYTITVSAISDQGTSYPSNPVVNSTFILQNCNVTSPSIGDIRVSCDSLHQIAVTVTCTNCNNPNMVTSSGSSPLTVVGLDPGIMYSVMINVFDGNQVVLTDQTVERTILVMGNQSGNNGSGNGSGSDSGSGSGSGSGSDDDDNGSDNDSNSDSDSDSSGSSAVAIAGGVIGGIVVVIIIVIIIIIMLYYFASYKKKDSTYDDTTNLNVKSPTSTGGSHVSAAETNGNTDSNGHSDKVLYAAPAKVVTIPHQTSAGGELYAVSTKAANKTSQAQSTSEHYDEVQDTKTAAQGITYAELQLSTELKGRDPTNHDTAVTYSQIA